MLSMQLLCYTICCYVNLQTRDLTDSYLREVYCYLFYIDLRLRPFENQIYKAGHLCVQY